MAEIGRKVMEVELRTDHTADGRWLCLEELPQDVENVCANEIYLLENWIKAETLSILDLSDPQRHAVVDATTRPSNICRKSPRSTKRLFSCGWRNAPKFSAAIGDCSSSPRQLCADLAGGPAARFQTPPGSVEAGDEFCQRVFTGGRHCAPRVGGRLDSPSAYLSFLSFGDYCGDVRR